jgi:hypothetical protein
MVQSAAAALQYRNFLRSISGTGPMLACLSVKVVRLWERGKA